MRAAIRAEVAAVEPLDDTERAHIEGVLAWIDSNVELCRTRKPATPPKHLVSYFVLVDHEHVLLGDHRNAQLWLPPGGHVEPGEHPRHTVSRELREELGIGLKHPLAAPLMVSCTQTVGATARHTDVSLWYVVDGDRNDPLDFDTNEYTAIKWFTFEEAHAMHSDPYLSRFLDKLSRARQQGSGAGR